ncbi:AMP-binding protein [Gordonia soli]|uniref:Putative fatty-acid--CoA ligase n=1 Tax=Gordonia soli NBRC 108243 TaxID=1223545 RepID=M0QFQ8_9ACTN|nr:AMP-binding protein [Gordonia soli]GAC67294.1 putative fatty-acid--CoA ligase [Gordonia soli NBRC 108243]
MSVQKRSARSARWQWWDAARAVAGSGVLAPPSPATAVRMARGVWYHGPTLTTLFAVAAARHPDKVAVVDDDGAITYAELYRQITALADHLLTDSGTGPRSIAVLCRNHRGFVVGAAAAAAVGAEVVAINTEMPETQLLAVLDRHRPDVLVHDDEYSEAIRSSDAVGTAICLDRETVGKGQVARPRRNWTSGRVTLLTSGTTGLAKGVPRTISPWGIVQLAATGCARIGLRRDDVALIGPPFFHGFGLVAALGAVAVGATMVCHRRFDARRMAEDIRRHDITVLYLVPVMVQRLLAQSDIDELVRAHRLRIAVTGAAPITSATVIGFHRTFGPILVNGYGSTEAGLVSIATPDDLVDEPSTVGTPALGVSIRITDDTGHRLPDGQTGKILVRGPLDYSGYTPDANAPARRKMVVDRHVDTGDVGHVDHRGRLFISGRSDDMIVSGGENVFPAEIEDVLSTHPAVADTVVVGVEDAEYGQVLNAFVVITDGSALDADELKRHVLASLERYKVPKRFVSIDAIPRNPSGKVMRGRLPIG